MVRELDSLRDNVGVIRKRQSATFPESAPADNPVFFRTYSRRTEALLKGTYYQVCDSVRGACALHSALRRNRTLRGLVRQTYPQIHFHK